MVRISADRGQINGFTSYQRVALVRIYDCFLYGGEERLLELRIKLLRDCVDVFVVVESSQTFTGRRRHAVGESVLRRHLSPSAYRYLLVSDISQGGAWEREAHQRNAILDGLVDADENDIIVVADVDEVPNPEVLSQIRLGELGSGNLEMVWHSWAYNLAYPRPWSKAKVLRMSDLTTPQKARETMLSRTYSKGGWHLSWIMSSGESIQKIESFSHTEINREAIKNAAHIDRCIARGVDLLGRDLLLLVPENKCAPGAQESGFRGADYVGGSASKRFLLLIEAAGRAWLPPAGRTMPRWMYVLAGVPRVILTRVRRGTADFISNRSGRRPPNVRAAV